QMCIRDRVEWNLSQFGGFVGINNHMGSSLTENPGLMVRVMVHLRKKGYLFLDSLTSPKSVGARAAIATGVPYIERDVFLDNDRTIAAILAQLEKTERIAKKRGYAVAIGHPYAETMKALQFWTAKLDKRTFTLVPISQLVAAQNQSETLAQALEQ
ncbi:MAG: divergent polysaccharide deacetylase family protein, partial [Parvibaculaceae bacterium]|nr:divergent polysaccharide deacetylase family protein [Parvibaculaceae bacterium]